MRKTTTALALFGASLIFAAGGVSAQAYPSKPIRFIVPYSGGACCGG